MPMGPDISGGGMMPGMPGIIPTDDGSGGGYDSSMDDGY
jgi:hypothetical protein